MSGFTLTDANGNLIGAGGTVRPYTSETRRYTLNGDGWHTYPDANGNGGMFSVRDGNGRKSTLAIESFAVAIFPASGADVRPSVAPTYTNANGATVTRKHWRAIVTVDGTSYDVGRPHATQRDAAAVSANAAATLTAVYAAPDASAVLVPALTAPAADGRTDTYGTADDVYPDAPATGAIVRTDGGRTGIVLGRGATSARYGRTARVQMTSGGTGTYDVATSALRVVDWADTVDVARRLARIDRAAARRYLAAASLAADGIGGMLVRAATGATDTAATDAADTSCDKCGNSGAGGLHAGWCPAPDAADVWDDGAYVTSEDGTRTAATHADGRRAAHAVGRFLIGADRARMAAAYTAAGWRVERRHSGTEDGYLSHVIAPDGTEDGGYSCHDAAVRVAYMTAAEHTAPVCGHEVPSVYCVACRYVGTGHDDAARGYAYVSDDGMAMLVNLTADDAAAGAARGVPRDGRPCYVTTNATAERLWADWSTIGARHDVAAGAERRAHTAAVLGTDTAAEHAPDDVSPVDALTAGAAALDTAAAMPYAERAAYAAKLRSMSARLAMHAANPASGGSGADEMSAPDAVARAVRALALSADDARTNGGRRGTVNAAADDTAAAVLLAMHGMAAVPRESTAYEHGRADAAAGRPMMSAADWHARYGTDAAPVRTYYVSGYQTAADAKVAAERDALAARVTAAEHADDDAALCGACGHPSDWHDASDGACPDDGAPHPYSVAADRASQSEDGWHDRATVYALHDAAERARMAADIRATVERGACRDLAYVAAGGRPCQCPLCGGTDASCRCD